MDQSKRLSDEISENTSSNEDISDNDFNIIVDKKVKINPYIIANTIGNNIMIFDTETNGLDANSDILQIGYIISNTENVIIKKEKFYISNRVNLPQAFKINGITSEILNEKGIPFYDVISTFISDLNTCNKIIGHNISFDINKINDNIKKYVIPIYDIQNNLVLNIFNDKEIICTLKMYSKYIKNINIERKKNNLTKLSIRLCSMFEYFFNHSFDNAHDALSDVIATFECYKKLIE